MKPRKDVRLWACGAGARLGPDLRAGAWGSGVGSTRAPGATASQGHAWRPSGCLGCGLVGRSVAAGLT